jgi:hypothetical protein
LWPQVGRDLISLVTSREGISELLHNDDVIDLVIPRGSNALVRCADGQGLGTSPGTASCDRGSNALVRRLAARD